MGCKEETPAPDGETKVVNNNTTVEATVCLPKEVVSYDANGEVLLRYVTTYVGSVGTTIAYDASGSETGRNVITYNEYGKPTETKSYNASGALTSRTTYAYNCD